MWEKIKTIASYIGFAALAVAGFLVGRRLYGAAGTTERVADDATEHRESLERLRAASRDTTAAVEDIADTAEALNGLANRSERKREEIADLDQRINDALSGSSHDWDGIDDIGD